MKYLIKPVTKKMLLKLKNARQIELHGPERRNCLPEDFKGSLSGLYSRGLVACRDCNINGKKLVGVYVTEAGIDFLNHFEEDSKLALIKPFSDNKLAI